MDPTLEPIRDKVLAGERLTADDGNALFASRDVWTIGELAHHVRTARHGQTTYYNVNRHLNYANVCALSCSFCEFHRKRGDEGAYEFTVEQVAHRAEQAQKAGATEMHIVGGLHPYLPFDYYTDMLAAVKQAAPKVHIKAFTAVEIVHLARISKRPKDIRGVLSDLIEAGLGSLPGGGAEVFDDRVHDEAFKGKIRAGQWLEVHRIAHELGLRSNATLLHGHIETPEQRVNHFLKLREEQDRCLNEDLPGHFQTVIPLPFFPDGSNLEHLPGPSALDNVKMIAISRLMLDNFDHVKSFWIMQTLPMSQLELDFGADDIDGTVVWYDITKVGGADNHQELTAQDLRDTILEAGYDPVERDTLYHRVIRDSDNPEDWRVEEDTLAAV